MDEKTFQDCRDKALKKYNKMPKKGKISCEVIRAHVITVEKIAILLCMLFDVGESDTYTIRLGAVLHDIKKHKKKHNEKGAEYFKNKFSEFDISDDEKKAIEYMIRYHKAKPKELNKIISDKQYEPYMQKISIVALADKISKVYKIDEKMDKKLRKYLLL